MTPSSSCAAKPKWGLGSICDLGVDMPQDLLSMSNILSGPKERTASPAASVLNHRHRRHGVFSTSIPVANNLVVANVHVSVTDLNPF